MDSEDHDLLIKVSKDVEYVKITLDEVKSARATCQKGCDGRLGSLERWRAYIVGIGALVAFLISIAVSLGARP